MIASNNFCKTGVLYYLGLNHLHGNIMDVKYVCHFNDLC